jgi:hypothetical protein
MRKAATVAIVIRVPGDRERNKAAKLATKLASVLEPAAMKIAAPIRRAELKIERIDVSVNKEELRHALAVAAVCKEEEVQVGKIGIARGGLGTAWVRCPVAGARKLARDRKVAVGWSWATVTTIPKRPLQCYRCLELGHVRTTCTSPVDSGNLCHRCGKSGHKARECTAAKPNCPLCEALDAPAGHRMGGIACVPPRIRKRRPPGREINKNYRRSPINVMRNDPGEVMETG